MTASMSERPDGLLPARNRMDLYSLIIGCKSRWLGDILRWGKHPYAYKTQRGVPPVHLRTSEYLHVFSCATMPSSRMRSWSHRSNNHLNSSSKTSGCIAKGGNGVTAAPPLDKTYAFLDASEQQSDEAATRGTTTFEVSMRQCTAGCGTSDVCKQYMDASSLLACKANKMLVSSVPSHIPC